jgi:hypothetical protein
MTALGVPVSVAVTSLLLVPLAACTNGSGRRNTSQEISIAENRVRDLYNRGACQVIYEEADDSFRHSEPVEDWLARCASARTRLGAWRRVGTQELFEKGDYRVQMIFAVEKNRSRLYWLVFKGDGKQWLRLDRPVIDPPPRRPAPLG